MRDTFVHKRAKDVSFLNRYKRAPPNELHGDEFLSMKRTSLGFLAWACFTSVAF